MQIRDATKATVKSRFSEEAEDRRRQDLRAQEQKQEQKCTEICTESQAIRTAQS